MATIDVDVDLDEFETRDLIEELSNRIGKGGRKGMNDAQKATFDEAVREALCVSPTVALPIHTVYDEMKLEHIQKVWGKYDPFQMAAMLPE